MIVLDLTPNMWQNKAILPSGLGGRGLERFFQFHGFLFVSSLHFFSLVYSGYFLYLSLYLGLSGALARFCYLSLSLSLSLTHTLTLTLTLSLSLSFYLSLYLTLSISLSPSLSSFIRIRSIFSLAWWLSDEAYFRWAAVMKTEIPFPRSLLWVFPCPRAAVAWSMRLFVCCCLLVVGWPCLGFLVYGYWCVGLSLSCRYC